MENSNLFLSSILLFSMFFPFALAIGESYPVDDGSNQIKAEPLPPSERISQYQEELMDGIVGLPESEQTEIREMVDQSKILAQKGEDAMALVILARAKAKLNEYKYQQTTKQQSQLIVYPSIVVTAVGLIFLFALIGLIVVVVLVLKSRNNKPNSNSPNPPSRENFVKK